MSRARDLFTRLQTGGFQALEELIADREPESMFLDFKRSRNDGADTRLTDDDNKNLSKAISGFANSAGGVIVWGVDCRKDAGGNEIASKHPLLDAFGFNTKLQSAISRTTFPPSKNVETFAFQESGISKADGYVAMYVPQSNDGPIRSVVTNHYHLRAGSDFFVVPHDVLAGMFGRRPQPSIDLNLVSNPLRDNHGGGLITFSASLIAVNLGSILSPRPYLTVFYGDTPDDHINFFVADQINFRWRRGPLPIFSMVALEAVAIAPGASERMCDVTIEVPMDKPISFSLNCVLGVDGAPPKRFALKASVDSMAEAIAQFRAGNRIHTMDFIQLVTND
jgi:Putative DNA-binding domain